MENKNPIPWYGYMMIAMVFIAPPIMITPFALKVDDAI